MKVKNEEGKEGAPHSLLVCLINSVLFPTLGRLSTSIIGGIRDGIPDEFNFLLTARFELALERLWEAKGSL